MSSICKTGGMVLGTDSGSWEEEADVSPTISMSSLDMSVDLSEPWVLDLSLYFNPQRVAVKIKYNNICPIVLWTANVCY